MNGVIAGKFKGEQIEGGIMGEDNCKCEVCGKDCDILVMGGEESTE